MSVSEKYRREMEEWQARLDARSREIRMLDEELAIAEGKPLGFYSRALEYALPLPMPPRVPASLAPRHELDVVPEHVGIFARLWRWLSE